MNIIIIALSLLLSACQSVETVASQKEREYSAFSNPERITIRGYSGHAMEPFIVEVSADGQTLYFVDGIFSGKPVPEKADITIAVRGAAGFRRLAASAELLKKITIKMGNGVSRRSVNRKQ